MTLFRTRGRRRKFCFAYCGPERCNCGVEDFMSPGLREETTDRYLVRKPGSVAGDVYLHAADPTWVWLSRAEGAVLVDLEQGERLIAHLRLHSASLQRVTCVDRTDPQRVICVHRDSSVSGRVRSSVAEHSELTVDQLNDLIAWARNHVMTPAEVEAQRKSWVVAEMLLEHPEFTRAECEAIYDTVHSRLTGRSRIFGVK